MTKVFIKEQSWLARLAAKHLGFYRVAMVAGRTIYLHNCTVNNFVRNKRWLAHELKHVEQFEQYGYVRFLLMYSIEYLRNGYYNNRFEAEARQVESDEELINKYDVCLCTKRERG